jgi:hypothetical protein
MDRINQERSLRFISQVTYNSKLAVAADSKAKDMIERSYFSHIDPDGNYVWPRIQAAGFTPHLILGENLAMDFTSASEVMTAWMNSPTHRDNIVNEKFQNQGLSSVAGLYEPDHETIMVVSLFGTLLKTTSPTPKPSPAPSQSTPPPPSPTPTTPSPAGKITISENINITTTSLSGHVLVAIDVNIEGTPTLVTARLKSQSISLIAGPQSGQFKGTFTFDQTEVITDEVLTIEARNKSGEKITLNQAVTIPTDSDLVSSTNQTGINVSNEAQVMKILRIVFAIFATIYMAFLAIDAIIIHRAKIKRDGAHSFPHLLVFALLTAAIYITL